MMEATQSESPSVLADSSPVSQNSDDVAVSPADTGFSGSGPDLSVQALDSDAQRVVLDQLPVEILRHIGGFLKPQEIAYSLCSASQRLNQLFGDEMYWRVRIKQQWPDPYPIISDRIPKPAIWKHRCQDREVQFKSFNKQEHTLQKKIFGAGQGGFVGGDVNAMCFSNNGKLLFTGGRDRQVILWDVEAIKKNSMDPTVTNSSADVQRILHTHGAWVWTLRCYDNLLSSGAWDCSICIFDLNHHLAAAKSSLRTSGSVTCHGWDKNLVIAGTFIGGVELFDQRKGPDPVTKKSQSHHHAVLGVHLDGEKVIMVGSDKKIQILDLRANEFLIKKNIPNNDYGTQLCVENGNVWVGTKRGQVLLYDQDDYELVEELSTPIGHTNQITGLHCDSGHVLTCAMDRSAKMSHPTRTAEMFWQYGADAGFTAMDFARNNTLGLAWGPVVGVWWPKDYE